MELLNMIIDFFAVDAIGSAQTFPEFLQAFCHLFMACFIVIFVFRALCGMNIKLSEFLNRF